MTLAEIHISNKYKVQAFVEAQEFFQVRDLVFEPLRAYTSEAHAHFSGKLQGGEVTDLPARKRAQFHAVPPECIAFL